MFEGGQDNKSKKRKVVNPHDPLDGYKGNFDATRFNLWFRALCDTLKREHGPCDIKMDSATYHRENLHKQPTDKTKTGLNAWLDKYEIAHDPEAKNTELLACRRDGAYDASLTLSQAALNHTSSCAAAYTRRHALELLLQRHCAFSNFELYSRATR